MILTSNMLKLVSEILKLGEGVGRSCGPAEAPPGCGPFKSGGRGRRSISAAVFLCLSVSAPGPRRLEGFPEGR